MTLEGHVGLSNEKREERTVGTFKVALSYLTRDSQTAYFVIHAFSNTFDASPYLQRTNLTFGGYDRGGRKNFLERLGFVFSSTCNIFNEGKCYFAVIEEVRRGDRFEEGIEGMLRIKAIYEKFRKFADSLEDIYNRMREIDQKLLNAGFELPWEDLKLAPVVFNKDEKVYEKGQVYDFYKDIREITQTAKNEAFVIDAYPDEEVLDLYLEKLSPTVRMRILTNKPKGNFIAIAKKFKQKPGITFEVRESPDCHDRVFFVDNSCWVMGQSIKDAGKKPTYLARMESHDLFRKVFEELWRNATSVV